MLLEHAKNELRKAGMLDNPNYKGALGLNVLVLMEAFAAQCHNEASSVMTLALFNSLARGEAITNVNPAIKH